MPAKSRAASLNLFNTPSPQAETGTSQSGAMPWPGRPRHRTLSRLPSPAFWARVGKGSPSRATSWPSMTRHRTASGPSFPAARAA